MVTGRNMVTDEKKVWLHDGNFFVTLQRSDYHLLVTMLPLLPYLLYIYISTN